MWESINIIKYFENVKKSRFGPSGTVAYPNNENIVIFVNLLTRVIGGAYYMPDSCFDMNSGVTMGYQKKKKRKKKKYIIQCPRQYTVIKQLQGSNLLVDYCRTSLLVSRLTLSHVI